METRKKYVQVGVGGRARFFYEAIAGRFGETSELVAFCDVNQTRMDYANRVLSGQVRAGAGAHLHPRPVRRDDRSTEPDAVIVTSIDRTHHRYIMRAMELGCDVITREADDRGRGEVPGDPGRHRAHRAASCASPSTTATRRTTPRSAS